MTSEDNCASTGLFALLDLVYLVKSLAFVGLFKLLGKVVVTNGTSEDNRSCWKDILISFGSVMQNASADFFALTAAPRAAFWEAPPAT